MGGDHCLAVDQVLGRQVCCVSALARNNRKWRRRLGQADSVEQSIDSDAAPAGIELRPTRHAMDVGRNVGLGQHAELRPVPGAELGVAIAELELPVCEIRFWGWSSRQYR